MLRDDFIGVSLHAVKPVPALVREREPSRSISPPTTSAIEQLVVSAEIARVASSRHSR